MVAKSVQWSKPGSSKWPTLKNIPRGANAKIMAMRRVRLIAIIFAIFKYNFVICPKQFSGKSQICTVLAKVVQMKNTPLPVAIVQFSRLSEPILRKISKVYSFGESCANEKYELSNAWSAAPPTWKESKTV